MQNRPSFRSTVPIVVVDESSPVPSVRFTVLSTQDHVNEIVAQVRANQEQAMKRGVSALRHS